MNNNVCVWLIACFITFSCCDINHSRSRWKPSYGHPLPVPQDIMVDTINYIGLALLKAHNRNNVDNNIALSPYGATSVLAVLSEGVQGIAFDEIVRASFLPLDSTVTRIGLRDIHRHLKSYFIPQEGFLAGLTFSHDNITLKPRYEELLMFYGYDIESFNTAFYPGATSTSPERTTETVPGTTSAQKDEVSISTSTIDKTTAPPSTVQETTTLRRDDTTTVTPSTVEQTSTTVKEAKTDAPTTVTTSEAPSTLPLTSTTLKEGTFTTPVASSTLQQASTTLNKITTGAPSTITNPVTPSIPQQTYTTTTDPPIPVTTTSVAPSTSTTVQQVTTTTTVAPSTIQQTPTVFNEGRTEAPNDVATVESTSTPFSFQQTSTIQKEDGTTAPVIITTAGNDPELTSVTLSVGQVETTTETPTTTSRDSKTISTSTKTVTSDSATETSTTIQVQQTNLPLTVPTSTESSVLTTLPTTPQAVETQPTESETTTSVRPLETSTLFEVSETFVPPTSQSVTSSTSGEITTSGVLETNTPTDFLSTFSGTQSSIKTSTSGTLETTTFPFTSTETQSFIKTTTLGVLETNPPTIFTSTSSGTQSSVNTTTSEALEISTPTASLSTENGNGRTASTNTAAAVSFEAVGRTPRIDDNSSDATLAVESTTMPLDTETPVPENRPVRSIVDYLVAKFHNNLPQYGTEYQYLPAQPLTFAVHGKTREPNISFMTYDTILPYRYINYLDASALVFPLDSTMYYLLLVLPNDVQGIDRLIENMMVTTLKQIVFNLHPTSVKATIPSFMLKGRVVLTPTFQELGIRQIFEPRHADFFPMTDDKDIYVTNIEQAVTVTIRNYVDPATLQNYNNGGYQQREPVKFTADHPFLYFVMDAHIHVALMAGKITNPLSSSIR